MHVRPRRPRRRSPGVEAPSRPRSGPPPMSGRRPPDEPHGAPGRRRGQRRRRCRTSGATSRSPATMPCSSIRATRTAARSPACAAVARAATRSGVCRRRETPRAGSGSRITPPSTAGPEVAARRSTNRSPVAAAIDASRRSTAAAAPSGSSSASRPARPTTASAAAVPRWTRKRARSGTGAASMTSSRSEGCTSGSFVRTTPGAGRLPPRLPGSARCGRQPRPRRRARRGPAPRGPRTARRRPARCASSLRAPADPPRSVPVTTVPRPLIGKRGRPRGAPAAAVSAVAARASASTRSRSPRAPPAARRRPSPVDAGDDHDGAPRATCVRASARRLGDDLADPLRRATGRPSSRPRAPCVDAERVEQLEVLERLGRGPSSAATTSIAASISPAPTSMLPISRSWPGTSTKSSSVPSATPGARTRRRSSCRAAAPRAAGRRRCRSARAGASSCRGRCGRRCR